MSAGMGPVGSPLTAPSGDFSSTNAATGTVGIVFLLYHHVVVCRYIDLSSMVLCSIILQQ